MNNQFKIGILANHIRRVLEEANINAGINGMVEGYMVGELEPNITSILDRADPRFAEQDIRIKLYQQILQRAGIKSQFISIKTEPYGYRSAELQINPNNIPLQLD